MSNLNQKLLKKNVLAVDNGHAKLTLIYQSANAEVIFVSVLFFRLTSHLVCF